MKIVRRYKDPELGTYVYLLDIGWCVSLDGLAKMWGLKNASAARSRIYKLGLDHPDLFYKGPMIRTKKGRYQKGRDEVGTAEWRSMSRTHNRHGQRVVW